jgi:anti-sigma-K factor RskA
VLAAAHAEAQASTPAPTAAKSGGFGFLPWALAAGFAITTAAFWTERNQLRQEADLLQKDVLALRTGDNFSKMRIASLSAQLDAYSKGTAVIVWDAEKQRGVVKLSNMPPAGSGKDYQLWVIDPKYAKPVNGGIIPISGEGLARVSFTPDQVVHKADKFAISVEKTGGVPQAEGPIVLLGE